ncbi:hypothetical protein RHECNPAF_1360070 [Rhizobium etli CNPAF512]|nr:hypothetical protein RHECNPAF_1360070 [Rhizobium etli CNPAF512]
MILGDTLCMFSMISYFWNFKQ